MNDRNTRVTLARRPVGMAAREDFSIDEVEIEEPAEGELLVRIGCISLDPAMRGWMNAGPSYVPPVEIGAVMRAFAAGYVEKSNNPKFEPGDAVAGLLGAQTYAVTDGKGITRVDESQAPLERWIGGLGMPGLTAYFGLLEVGKPKEGETVLVSAASGAVGSIVGQIAKIKGCRAVGIAGGPDKCRAVVEELGFDACVDYKAATFNEDLAAACPDGVDVYFDNVGGDILDAALARMNLNGRIAICGLISMYNATELPPGPKNLRYVIVNRLRIQGLLVFDYIKQFREAASDLGRWHSEGKLVMREDVREGGLEAFPDVLNLLYTGGNNGKLVLKL